MVLFLLRPTLLQQSMNPDLISTSNIDPASPINLESPTSEEVPADLQLNSLRASIQDKLQQFSMSTSSSGRPPSHSLKMAMQASQKLNTAQYGSAVKKSITRSALLGTAIDEHMQIATLQGGSSAHVQPEKEQTLKTLPVWNRIEIKPGLEIHATPENLSEAQSIIQHWSDTHAKHQS